MRPGGAEEFSDSGALKTAPLGVRTLIFCLQSKFLHSNRYTMFIPRPPGHINNDRFLRAKCLNFGRVVPSLFFDPLVTLMMTAPQGLKVLILVEQSKLEINYI